MNKYFLYCSLVAFKLSFKAYSLYKTNVSLAEICIIQSFYWWWRHWGHLGDGSGIALNSSLLLECALGPYHLLSHLADWTFAHGTTNSTTPITHSYRKKGLNVCMEIVCWVFWMNFHGVMKVVERLEWGLINTQGTVVMCCKKKTPEVLYTLLLLLFSLVSVSTLQVWSCWSAAGTQEI